MLPDADSVRIRHMLDAARDAIGFLNGRGQDELALDRQLALSLVKCLEIIGEAASRVSPESRATLPEIPWANIIGMRNRLIHGYFDVNLAIVWRTVKDELPPLVGTLERALV